MKITYNKQIRGSRLTPLRELDERRGRLVLVECQCSCGRKVNVPRSAVLSRRTKSCGCLQRERAFGNRRRPGSLNDIFWSNLRETDYQSPRLDPKFGTCWDWTGEIAANGYGVLHVPDVVNGRKVNRNVRATHIAALLFTDRLPEGGEQIAHACDHRTCCRPSHIAVTSAATNTYDRMRKAEGGVIEEFAGLCPTELEFQHVKKATRRKNQKKNKSGYVGVTLHKTGRWQAQMHRNGKYVYLGLYPTVEEAARVYQETKAL